MANCRVKFEFDPKVALIMIWTSALILSPIVSRGTAWFYCHSVARSVLYDNPSIPTIQTSHIISLHYATLPFFLLFFFSAQNCTMMLFMVTPYIWSSFFNFWWIIRPMQSFGELTFQKTSKQMDVLFCVTLCKMPNLIWEDGQL